ncbi:putative multiple ankyrin repeats single kh domain protein [Schistosoma mansoni]|uniref:putative multiple ankyrin repeats single kh domain protein n=1 Tax=Schistosoma mansoni TaxID=6183 RepID=UPI00022DCC2D|nr:putative multiple ankyrin repeats single kh domain protein [Schistosoma mansoni]|eukprot:XP_018654746.1 putative multiple ankyrin repeats single kh domain protein [Schistosoma mansoni]
MYSSSIRFENSIPDLCPETQLNFRKFLQAAGIENMLIKDGRRISDTEVLNEIRKEVAVLSMNDDDGRTSSLILACINGDDEAVKLLILSGECDVNEVAPDGETALTCAISSNAVRIVEMLLKHGSDPNFRGKKVECTPLMEAASVGYTDIVKLLLEHGACVAQKSNTGNTALHYAATSGHLECVCLLLQYNSPMEVQNDTGHTPLMEATSNGHVDVARCLIKHGCDINTHSAEFKESALTLASYKGHAEMVRFLLTAGADHEHRTDEMHTALMEAAMEGHVEVARLLLAHGANVNIPQDSFESPLTLAACGGHTELAHLLIGYGADIEEVNDEGYTPLMEAAREGHEETVALLLAVGAEVNARTEETQETALTLAACGGFIEVCEMLLNAGADIEVGGVGCSTPLMEAAQEGHLELVRRLLERGALVNAVTATGDTALHYAAENGHVKVCEKLLDWGAVFGAMTEGGRTPLMKAARTGHLEVVQLFLERGVAIDQPTSQNDANALSLACSGGHAKMVEFLLQHGADPQYQLRDGSTMLIEAARSGNPAVLRLILDYPKCLSQPSSMLPNASVQLVANTLNQHQTQHQFSHDQRSAYQSLVSGVPTIGNVIMPPPPPPLPISVSGIANMDIYFLIFILVLDKSRFIYFLLFKALFQELMPDLKADKDELIKRFEAVMCPFSTLRAARTAISQRNGSNLDSPTAIAMSTNAAVLALSKLIDQQSQCRAHSSYPGNGCEILEQHLSPRCIHASSADAVLSKTTQWTGMLSTSCDTQFPEPIPFSTECSPSLSKAPDDQPDHTDSNDHNFSAAANVTPVMSSCHSSCSALSTSECSMSSVHGYQHVTHPTLLPVSGSRVLPVGPQPILSSGGASIPNHGLSPNDMAAVASNNLSMMGDTISPLNVPSLIDVNACIESSMETALTLACSGGFVDLVRLLLERGADKEHRDKKSHTPLHTAVCANQRSVVSLLLDYGADIEAQVDRTKDTALSIACSHGKLEIVEELLNRGANKEHRNISDYTPLSLAASGGYVEVIQLLLRHGAEINSRTGSKLGISPLMLASMNGHTVAVRLLLEHGSDINAHIETNRNTALTLACFQGRYEVVQLLVERKANIEHRAKTGLTPLMEAASGDYVEVGRILLDYGADVNASPVPSSRDTALTIAADKGNAKFVNLLLEKGGVVEARNKKGATPLWLASNGGHLEVVQSLIQYNADVNSQDNRKVSCLMAAFRKGHINVVRLLVQYVTQFPSDKDCIRHIKTAVTDKELAKRCQQCREIIIAAKEKQEGEAKKNADCLLEQIEQEEEERANREAMQARKRERKRMKRKAKQEKERQVKGTNQTHTDSNVDASSRSNTTAETNENKRTNQDLDEQFSVEHSPTLSRVLQHAHESSLCNQLSDAIIYDVDDKQCSAFRNPSGSPVTVVPMSPESSKPNQQIVKDVHLNSDSSITNVEKPNVQQDSDSIDNSFCSQEAESNAAAVTEAKREKHRNKKQSQRAAKRAAAENNTPFDLDKVSKSPSPEIQDPINSSVSPCYALSPSGDNENWNLLIESQSAHFGQYFNIGKSSNAVSDSSTWTVVVPSNSTRSQRTAVSTHVSSRVGNEMADWKTTNSSNSSYKRRLSIPVSRHDIGKVIGQGGAVVSALRNMSGIQIDIESARSDEVTERMVYLKGPSEAVQRTYETIQGLLDGSIAGNDVLLMYHALKKSSTLPSSMPLSSTALGSLSSRLNGTTSVTVQNTIKSGLSSVKVINPSNRTPRRTGKSVTSPLAANTTRSTSTQPTPLPVVSKPTKTPTISIVNNSSNITFSSTTPTLIPLISSGLKTSTSGSASWSSKVSNTSSSKGNFASVAAAGISTHSSRLVKPVDNQIVKSVRSQSKTTVQNLMTAPASALSLSTTTPVSLLSLNLSPFSSSSHMFPDFIPSLSNVGDFCTDSLDEVSFPPLNPSKCTKITQSRTTTTTVIPAVTVSNMRNPSYLSNTHVSSSSVNCPVESVSFEMDKLKINTSSGDLTYMLSISVFDSPVSTVHTASVSNSFPLTTLSTTSSSNYGPLTVSPTCGVVQTSQSNTPMGSGSTHTPAYVSTPPTTTTQTKSFARAPGSERSAHQRNANVTATSVSLGLNDSFPPSLLSLDVNGNSNVSVNGGANDTTLFTPTKRAIASDIHNPDFRHDSISNHFRTDRSCEWQTSDSSAAPAQSSAFVKNTTFSVASNTLTITSTSVGSSVIDSHSAMDSVPVVTNVSQTRDPIGSLHSMPILWSASRPDLNPNSISFQPSFQTLNQVVPNLKASAESADSLIQASLLRNDFSNHSVSDQFQDQYSTQGAQSGVLRQMVTQASLQKSNPVGLSYLQSAHQQTQNSNCSSGLNISSTPSLLPTSSANTPLNASFRFKPPMSGTSAYLESRPTALNGFPSGFCSPSTSSMSLNNQFSSIFPITQQQSFPLQQQLSLGPGTISALNQHTTSGLSTRLGNSSHPMINQTQLSMCSSGPGGSYTPPPFMTGYVQPSIQPVCSSTSVIHPNTNYTSHLINGFSSSSHIGTVCTPTVGAGVPLGIPSNTAQGPVQNQPVPIQPIGAERRRQANTLTSVTSSSIVYPNMSSNNNLAGPVNSAAPVVANPLATMHPQAPSPQQCSVNSNANNLLMAFTMNWMQQQHQQQQHSNLVSGVSGTVNSPANWPPPMWPSNNLNNNYPVTCPPMKVPPCNPNDMNIYNNSAILPNTLPAVNGVAGHQHQQSIMAAAMAAMANIYPWNSGSGNGSGNSGILSGIPGISTAGSNRWVCPQVSTAFPGVNPSTPQPYYQEQYPTVKPSGGN